MAGRRPTPVPQAAQRGPCSRHAPGATCCISGSSIRSTTIMASRRSRRHREPRSARRRGAPEQGTARQCGAAGGAPVYSAGARRLRVGVHRLQQFAARLMRVRPPEQRQQRMLAEPLPVLVHHLRHARCRLCDQPYATMHHRIAQRIWPASVPESSAASSPDRPGRAAASAPASLVSATGDRPPKRRVKRFGIVGSFVVSRLTDL